MRVSLLSKKKKKRTFPTGMSYSFGETTMGEDGGGFQDGALRPL